MPFISFVLLILINDNSKAKIKMYGKTTSPWGTPYFSRIFGEFSPEEEVGLSIAEEELDPSPNGLSKVESFQAFIYVLVGKRVKRLPEVNEQDEGFEFPSVGVLHQIQDFDDAGPNHIAWYIGFLLLPYYSTNHRS